MIFTLGHRRSYLVGLSLATDEKPFRKSGPRKNYFSDGADYLGGSVWETAQEVWDYIDEGSLGELRYLKMSVFALDADWETQTVMVESDRLKGSSFRRLLVDAIILREEKK